MGIFLIVTVVVMIFVLMGGKAGNVALSLLIIVCLVWGIFAFIGGVSDFSYIPE